MVLSSRDDPAPVKIQSFVTLGAGVQTLSAIEKYSRSRTVVTPPAGTASLRLLVLLAAGVRRHAFGCAATDTRCDGDVALGGQAYAATKCAPDAHAGRLDALPGAAQDRPLVRLLRDRGPRAVRAADRSREKVRASTTRKKSGTAILISSDHVLYWQNPEQVVGPLAR